MKKKSVIKLPFPELLYPYSPVAVPMPPPPVQSACDYPRVTVEFACSLIPYLLGLLEIYRYKDSFSGTDEQNTIAVGVMRQLMEILAMAGCGCDEDIVRIRRINPETGEVEISEDDGVTWTTDPQSPYVKATIAVPLIGPDGDVKRCEAANNVIEHLMDQQGAFSEKIGAVNSLLDMVIAILIVAVGMLFLGLVSAALIALISPLLTKLFEVGRFLMTTTTAQYDALFTQEAWTLTRCILYCHVSPDGSFSQSAWSAVQIEIKQQMGTSRETVGANLAAMVDVWGLVGLNNAARIGSGTEGNCDDCTCTDCIDAAFIMHGTLVGVGDNYIDIQSVLVNYNGLLKQWAVYGDDIAGFCCFFCEYGMVDGLISSGGLIDCNGDAYPTGAPNNIRRVEFYHDTTVFTIRYFFNIGGGCP